MASLNTAFKSISPYQDTQIYSEHDLLQCGYIPISQESAEDGELCVKLVQTVESIKAFVWQNFKLVGINNEGKIPPFLIHLKNKNAFYRPGNLECFKFNDSFVSCPEVVCHEFTHGIVEHLNKLGNKGEAGAINESIADVVGIVFKCTIYARNDWKIAKRDLSVDFKKENLMTSEVVLSSDLKGNTITNDNGNVHHNSQLLSHAFYEASKDLNHQGDKILLKIWMDVTMALKEKTFKEFISNTVKLGYESGSPFGEAIQKAWENAGYHFDKTT